MITEPRNNTEYEPRRVYIPPQKKRTPAPGRELHAVKAIICASALPPHALICLRPDGVDFTVPITPRLIFAATAAEHGLGLYIEKGVVSAVHRLTKSFRQEISSRRDVVFRMNGLVADAEPEHIIRHRRAWQLTGLAAVFAAPRAIGAIDAAYDATYRAGVLADEVTQRVVQDARYVLDVMTGRKLREPRRVRAMLTDIRREDELLRRGSIQWLFAASEQARRQLAEHGDRRMI